MHGLKTIESRFTPEETIKRLETHIVSQGLTIFAKVEHSRLAVEAGLELRPTTLVLFGNPRGGTPLMQANQTIGIDLPLTALIWLDASGKTWFSYNEPSWLAKRHELKGMDRPVGMMDQALAAIAEKVTQAP
ncbi:MAG TPA: DUF302 domain-containing protein [Verrucomicrobiae bacterium]|nr:DUF302 domain-containing protein [Verrucomicrobiae bacterium]